MQLNLLNEIYSIQRLSDQKINIQQPLKFKVRHVPFMNISSENSKITENYDLKSQQKFFTLQKLLIGA